MRLGARPAFLFGILFLLTTLPGMAKAEERVLIGFGPSLTSALDVIADSQGFFAQEGLAAELVEFSRGSKALEALLEGKIDLSSTTTFAFVAKSFNSPGLRIVSTVAVAGNDNQLIARRDRGIASISDLKGKRVGALKGGMSQYVLDLLLLQGGLSGREVTVVLDEPAPQLERLIRGDLDALCIFGTWFNRASEALGANGVVFTDESLVRVTTFGVALEGGLRERPLVFSKILKAYIRAEEFIRANPDRALEILVKRFKLDLDSSKKLWKPNLFHVALDQSIIGDLENMARWNVDSRQVKASSIPNYLDFIWFKSLKEIDPRRVTVIHGSGR